MINSFYSFAQEVSPKVEMLTNQNGQVVADFQNIARGKYLLALFILFLVITFAIARKKGLFAFLGMTISILIIFYSVIPNILNGYDPVMSVVLSCILIVPILYFVSHGLNKKTLIAVFSTLISIIVIGILSAIFINLTQLTGFSSEEASFLQVLHGTKLNMQGILLAGIIIGALGVLDDITIAQVGIVEELAKANQKLNTSDLYKRAMNIGQDHIASMINTLVLVYAGASLPLFLLFVNNPQPLAEVFNYELIAEEIVRMLVGSIGLVLAVPISTYLAAISFSKK